MAVDPDSTYTERNGYPNDAEGKSMLKAHLLREQGYRQREIAERLGVSERTVRNYLKSEPAPRKVAKRASMLDGYRELIGSVLERQPSYNLVLLLKRLRRSGYRGSMTILREYAAALRKKITTEAIIRFETEPGYQAQVDWKELGRRTVDGVVGKLYAFVMVLGYSRKPSVRFTTSMREAVLLACLQEAFQYFGGVVAELLFDNMKTAFLADAEGLFHPNRRLLAFAHPYGFTPRRCRVRRPQTKGKVERLIGYLSGNFLAQVSGQDLSLEELNGRLRAWLAEVGEAELRDFAESREARFTREQGCLSPLPLHPLDCRETAEVYVSRESLFAYEGARYSAPAEWIGETLLRRRDPLSRAAELYQGRSLIRRFTLLPPGERGPLWDPADRLSVQSRWERGQRRRLSVHPSRPAPQAAPDVEIRSPSAYERLLEEAVS